MTHTERTRWMEDLRSPDKEKRAAAMRHLAGSGYNAVPSLRHLLHDTDWKVRYRAAEALGMIQAPDTVDDLIRATGDEKDHVRYMAAKALNTFGTYDAIPVLLKLTSDENEYVRKMATAALVTIREKNSNS